jgi:hypothetical protein
MERLGRTWEQECLEIMTLVEIFPDFIMTSTWLVQPRWNTMRKTPNPITQDNYKAGQNCQKQLFCHSENWSKAQRETTIMKIHDSVVAWPEAASIPQPWLSQVQWLPQGASGWKPAASLPLPGAPLNLECQVSERVKNGQGQQHC